MRRRGKGRVNRTSCSREGRVTGGRERLRERKRRPKNERTKKGKGVLFTLLFRKNKTIFDFEILL